MKNRIVGIVIVGISALIGFIIFSFNRALSSIIDTACTHGTVCPMWGTLRAQTNISIGIVVFIVVIGLYLIFFGKEERIVTKIERVKEQIKPTEVTVENFEKVMAKLNDDEKLILEKIIEAKGTIFQSELVDNTEYSKVKVTRILDKLEGRDIIERKRRGMTNVVILKH
ncbi:hypothetical protein HOC35_03945 [Candidatus Woesearchaeota archaeon]|jgi:uncharacterized membrane protein|nr:hypothetical protein [Candidatus Woesearchaeota archaeon]